jgi:hypothetical protein
MITVNDISVQFCGTTFSDVFAINENDKIALMGKMERVNQRFKIIAGKANRQQGIFLRQKRL